MTGLLRRVMQWPRLVPVFLLRAYRLLVSPMYGDTCRFYPSCSAYALQAFERHGVFRGGWLAARRLLRCHPWNPGGVDPVPPVRGHSGGADTTGCPSGPHPEAPSLRRAA